MFSFFIDATLYYKIYDANALSVNDVLKKGIQIYPNPVENNFFILSEKDAVLLALGVAINEKSSLLVASLEELAKAKGVEEKELLEVASCVSLMNANNVFYRFRHFMDKESYNNIPAGIRMSIMMNPVLGKEFFELLSLVISAINGCEMCVTSHEASVKSHGASEQRIFEAVRLGAVLKSFIVLL